MCTYIYMYFSFSPAHSHSLSPSRARSLSPSLAPLDCRFALLRCIVYYISMYLYICMCICIYIPLFISRSLSPACSLARSLSLARARALSLSLPLPPFLSLPPSLSLLHTHTTGDSVCCGIHMQRDQPPQGNCRITPPNCRNTHPNRPAQCTWYYMTFMHIKTEIGCVFAHSLCLSVCLSAYAYRDTHM